MQDLEKDVFDFLIGLKELLQEYKHTDNVCITVDKYKGKNVKVVVSVVNFGKIKINEEFKDVYKYITNHTHNIIKTQILNFGNYSTNFLNIETSIKKYYSKEYRNYKINKLTCAIQVEN